VTLGDLGNRVAVQLFRRLPWMADRWARRHRFVTAESIPWACLRHPIRDSRVALVTTAGIHLRGDRPFDMRDPDGDPSYRVIPADTGPEDLQITHKYYDHAAADRDPDVVLPLRRLRELHAAGEVGGLAPRCYGFMGHVDGRHLPTLMEVTAPEVAGRLAADGAQAVVLTPA
jgi:D-proline reductase (dithiol) PrdB